MDYLTKTFMEKFSVLQMTQILHSVLGSNCLNSIENKMNAG